MTEQVSKQEEVEVQPANEGVDQSPTESAEPKQEARELTREEKTEISIHGLYDAAGRMLLAKLNSLSPDQAEHNARWVDNYLMNIKPYHITSTVAASRFFEMWSQHVVQSKDPIPRPVFFQMNNLEVLFQRYAPCLNQAVLNNEPPAGSDPTLEFLPLPFELLKQNGGVDKQGKRISIPIKFETFEKIGYGFLELFETEEKNPIDPTKTVRLLTEFPAIRVNQSYIAPHAIYRWKRVEKKDVMNAWHTKKGFVTKKVK